MITIDWALVLCLSALLPACGEPSAGAIGQLLQQFVDGGAIAAGQSPESKSTTSNAIENVIGHQVEHYPGMALQGAGKGIVLYEAGPNVMDSHHRKYFRLRRFAAGAVGEIIDIARPLVSTGVVKLAAGPTGFALLVELDQQLPKQLRYWRFDDAGMKVCESPSGSAFLRAAIGFRDPQLVLVATTDDNAPNPVFRMISLGSGCTPTTIGPDIQTALHRPGILHLVPGGSSMILIATRQDNSAKSKSWQMTAVDNSGVGLAQSPVVQRAYVAGKGDSHFLPCAAQVADRQWLVAATDVINSRRYLLRRHLDFNGQFDVLPDLDIGPIAYNSSGDWCFADRSGRVCVNSDAEFGAAALSFGSPQSTFVCFALDGKQLGTLSQLKKPHTYVGGVAVSGDHWGWWLMPNVFTPETGHLVVGPASGGPGADALVDLK